MRRRRGRRPLEGRGVPRIDGRAAARHDAPHEVDGKDDLREPQRDGAHGDDDVPVLLVLEELVLQRIVDPPHLPPHPDDVHGEEGEIEEDEGQPEVEMPQPVVHHAAEHLGEPVVDAGEGAEDGTAEDHVVDVGHDEVRVLDVDIHRGRGHEDARQTADDEHRHEGQRIQHRYRELDPPAPQGSQPVERLDGRGHRDDHGGDHEGQPRAGFMPDTNMWWPYTIQLRKAMAIMEKAMA